MLERQFAEFLTSQIKSKVAVLERETDHVAAKDLKVYVEQLDGIFTAVFADSSETQSARTRRKRTQTDNE